MSNHVALLRGINVGGNALPMAALRKLCIKAGFQNVQTYIQSGNVAFESEKPASVIQAELEAALESHLKKPIPVILRTPESLAEVLLKNPFPDAVPSKVGVLFLPGSVTEDIMEGMAIPGREVVVVAGIELYIHYPDGMGRSRLKLPKAVAGGTMRNINTVAKMVEKFGK